MSLSGYEPSYEDVVVNRSTVLRVRAIGMADIAILLGRFWSDVENVFAIYQSTASGSIKKGDPWIVSMLKDSPELVANLIALACDEPTHVERAKLLPLPVQIDAVQKIGKLTFEETGGPKKFLETLSQLFANMQPVPKAANSSPGSPKEPN